jgi:protoporphyrinogen oxidase
MSINDTNRNGQNKNGFYKFLIVIILILSLIILEIQIIFFYYNNLNDSNGPNEIETYNIVIVGGGLAGLSTAYHLNNFSNVLILEKENKLGGRVNTIFLNNTPIDLGATFGMALSIPFNFTKPHILVENGSFGVYYQNNVTYGVSVMDVINKLNITQEVKDEIIKFKNKEVTAEQLNETSYNLLNSLFKVIFPGELIDYIPTSQQAAFVKWNIDHYETGASIIVDAYKERINANISLNSTVNLIDDEGDKVRIYYQKNGVSQQVIANVCIVATPGNVAKWLIKNQSDETSNFLNSLRYGAITVVSFLLPAGTMDNFSYIITHDSPFNDVLKYSHNNGYEVISIYYMDNESHSIYNLTDSELISFTLDELNAIDIGNVSDDIIVNTIVKRWGTGATIITPESYDNWDYNKTRPSDRVFLAGDYVWVDLPINPLGMQAAILSGEYIAKNVSQFFT